jgi:hypothetical protein
MIVGSIWYAKGVFGGTWAKLAHVDMDKKTSSSDMIRLMVTVFVISLITAYILAHMAFVTNHFFRNSFLQDSVSTAFWLWIGFTAMRIWTHDLFEGRPTKLTLLTWGNEFATLFVMAIVIGLMKP